MCFADLRTVAGHNLAEQNSEETQSQGLGDKVSEKGLLGALGALAGAHGALGAAQPLLVDLPLSGSPLVAPLVAPLAAAPAAVPLPLAVTYHQSPPTSMGYQQLPGSGHGSGRGSGHGSGRGSGSLQGGCPHNNQCSLPMDQDEAADERAPLTASLGEGSEGVSIRLSRYNV